MVTPECKEKHTMMTKLKSNVELLKFDFTNFCYLKSDLDIDHLLHHMTYNNFQKFYNIFSDQVLASLYLIQLSKSDLYV